MNASRTLQMQVLDSKPMRSIPLRLWILAILSSLLQVLPFPIAGPAPIWRRLFCWFCLTPLLFALLGRNKRGSALSVSQAAMLAYVCGFFWYIGNCYWIYQTMHTYGEIPKAGSLGILVLFALYVALYHALFGGLVGTLRRKFARQTVLWIVPFLWVGVELARAKITGFPWDLLGYTQVDNLGLTQLAPWTGVMGLSFLVAFVNIFWISEFRFRGKRSIAPGIAIGLSLVFICILWGWENVPACAGKTASAVLVQENLSVNPGASSETTQQMLSSFTNLSLHPTVVPQNNPDKLALIAWPESPAAFFATDPAFLNAMSSLAKESHTPVVVNDIGLAGRTPSGGYEEYNSAAFFRPDGSYAGHYDKMRLVPFGEYVPYKPLFFFAGDLLNNLPFVPGIQRRLFVTNGKKYGVFICYESIFGDDIRHFVDDGAQVLVNISDDGWYGDSSAPWEHLDMVRMRAIENDRWLLRATNTGITVAIDPRGRITARMPRHVRGSIQVNFGSRDDLTFYARHGDWFGWLCALVSIAFLGWGGIKRSKLETA
jgi:apolipoprotein N-acyltransferase